MRVVLPVVHSELIPDSTKYQLWYGSRGGGKTATAIIKLYLWTVKYNLRAKIMRRFRVDLTRLTLLDIEEILQRYKIPYELKKSEGKIFFKRGFWVLQGYYVSGSGKREEKIKGGNWDMIWLEEATEFTEKEFKEVTMTLRGNKGVNICLMTFNPPASSNHWIYKWYEYQEKRGLARRVFFSYKDNPYLPEDYKRELESLKDVDINLYHRYVEDGWGFDFEGERIYTDWEVGEVNPDTITDWVGGIDWGYIHPTVFVLVGFSGSGDMVYIADEFYIKGMVDVEPLAEAIRDKCAKYGVDVRDLIIYADPSDPDKIEALRRCGFWVKKAKKDVLAGIYAVKRFRVVVNPDCVGVHREMGGYVWQKDRSGQIVEVPVKMNDDGMDAIRYAVYSSEKSRSRNNIRGAYVV